MSEPSDLMLRFRRVRPVNRLFYRFMLGILRNPILSYFRITTMDESVVPPSGAGIIVANHATLFDPIWVYAMLRRPVYFAATEELFRKRFLGRLISWFGAFPKRKAASDITALRSIFSIIEKGGLVGLFPEGVRTWDGSNQPLFTGIAKLVRKMGVPVYACRLEGAYLVYPRWARHWRRVPLRGVFSRVYDGTDIPGDDHKVLSDLAAAIRSTDFDRVTPAPAVRRGGLAVNVTRVLYRCPSCGTMEGLKLVRPFSTNRMECSSCFSEWVIDSRCRLSVVDEHGTAEGGWVALPEHYEHIRSMPLMPIRSQVKLGLARGEHVLLISRPRFLFIQEKFPNLRVFAFGRAFLTDQRLVFRTRIGIPLSAPVTALGALSVDPGDKLHFTYQGKLYRMPFRNESALKWFDAIHRVAQTARAGAAEAAELRAAAPSGR
ncbi:MAG TPA: lysophospholipid acyltransferase family protein [Spirochaetia bacterium]|nr:lysophospholipid acyltransferase family protein [Spirochaetia bacterium]